jgi:site-specific DNA-cytosine methylase
VAVIQGFPADWGVNAGLSEFDLIRGYGNAVPPPLAEALFRAVQRFCPGPLGGIVEICAGFGGMALGASRGLTGEHLAMIDNWAPAIGVLRRAGRWPAESVFDADITAFDWGRFAGRVDLLCGGPPCQPWSKAGAGRGERDERDLLGFMPDLVATLAPQAFVFENVPGLLQGENEVYAAWLIRRLRQPRAGLDYGVAGAILNAADYGVPQVRRRVFIVGFRDYDVAVVHRMFDDLDSRRTHTDPRSVIPAGRSAWRTIGEAIPDWGDGGHAWRRWVEVAGQRETNGASMNHLPANTATPTTANRRIQLLWPHRGTLPVWSEANWHLDGTRRDDATRASLLPQPLLPVEHEWSGDPERDPWYLIGDPLATIDALQRTLARQADLAYIDLPRIETDATSFDAAEASARLDTWLTVVHALLRRCLRLLDDQGVLVALCGVDELPYVQQMLVESQGQDNMIGVVAWQKGYSPRNMPGMKELTPTHDNLVVFAKRKAALRPVTLLVPPDGYKHPDGDPRGPWNADQKGANKPDFPYEIHLCPYRWRIVGGEVPPGVWRINPKSGVIWARKGDLGKAGTWTFTVEVEDRKGAKVGKQFSIRVAEDIASPGLATIPWLEAGRDQQNQVTGGPDATGDLRILTESLPAARLGEEYSVCVVAAGGEPWTGQTRPGKSSTSGSTRYWEFPFKTLHEAAARDAVDFKSTDDAIPAIKSYLEGATTQNLNQMSVWLGRGKKGEEESLSAGYSADAKKEIQALVEQGIVSKNVLSSRAKPSPLSISKPSPLIFRLLGLFTRADGVVVDVGSPAAEMASAATVAGRKAVHVELPTSASFRDDLLVRRLAAAAQGRHPVPTGVLFLEEKVGPDVLARTKRFYLEGRPRPRSDQGGVCCFSLGPPFATIDRVGGAVMLDYMAYPTASPSFLWALASIEGLLPLGEKVGAAFARGRDGRLALYVGSGQFLDERLVRRLLDEAAPLVGPDGKVRVYYHRGQQGRSIEGLSGVELRLIPFQLQVASGLL